MSEKLVYAYNAVSGVTAEVPERYLNHPILGKHLRQVRTDKPIINAPRVAQQVVEVKTEASAEADVVAKPASKKTEKEKE